MTTADTFSDFIHEALTIIDLAQKRGIPVRLMGALAIYHHCPKFRLLYEDIEREPTDIDLITYSKFNKQVLRLLPENGFIPDQRTIAIHGRKRHVYRSNKSNRVIDVFFDKLEMCHIIDFRGRLEIDYPTISLADLFLTKMQIVKINEKDIKDTIVLLREHDAGCSDEETVNMKYIARLLSSDWGFYYTVTTNLRKTKEYLSNYGILMEKDREDVLMKVNKIIDAVESKPKTLRWRLRSKLGISKKWYQEVE